MDFNTRRQQLKDKTVSNLGDEAKHLPASELLTAGFTSNSFTHIPEINEIQSEIDLKPNIPMGNQPTKYEALEPLIESDSIGAEAMEQAYPSPLEPHKLEHADVSAPPTFEERTTAFAAAVNQFEEQSSAPDARGEASPVAALTTETVTEPIPPADPVTAPSNNPILTSVAHTEKHFDPTPEKIQALAESPKSKDLNSADFVEDMFLERLKAKQQEQQKLSKAA